MSTTYKIQDTTLTAIANAIRTKTGGSAGITPEDMPNAIDNISSGGGSTTLILGAIRPDADLVEEYKEDALFVEDLELSFPSYTTTATSLRATVNLSPSITVDPSTYDYFIIQYSLAKPIYTAATLVTGRSEYCIDNMCYEMTSIPSGTVKASNGTLLNSELKQTVQASNRRMFYWNSSKTLTSTTNGYAIYHSHNAPTFSGQTLNIRRPTPYIRGGTSYFSTDAWSLMEDVRLQYIIRVYRVPRGNLNLDGWSSQQLTMHTIDCVNNNNGKLT